MLFVPCLLLVAFLSLPVFSIADACRDSTSLLSKDTAFLLKTFDSWGKPSGVLQGSFTALGDYDECISLNAATNASIRMSYALIEGLLNIKISSAASKISLNSEWGICVPSDCLSKDDIQGFLNRVFDFIRSQIPGILFSGEDIGGISLSYTVNSVHPAHETSWTTGAIVFLSILAYLLKTVAFGTIWEYFKERVTLRSSSKPDQGSEEPLLGDKRITTKRQSKFGFLLHCFSIQTGLKSLFSAGSDKYNELACLNTIRVITMWWVVLCHVCGYFLEKILIDQVVVLEYLKEIHAVLILNGFFSVETFFYLSAFLCSYMMLSNPKVVEKFNYFGFVLSRYMRLAPAYMIVMFFWYLIYPHLGSGPQWFTRQDEVEISCAKYWWSHLLFINNFIPAKMMESCMPWSWYVACDFQLYLLLPIFVLFLGKKDKAWISHALAGAVFLVTNIVILWTSVARNLVAVATPDAKNASLESRAHELDYWQQYFYVLPWSHSSIVLGGVYCAHFALNRRQAIRSGLSSMSYREVSTYQFIGAGLLIAALYSPFSFMHDLSRWSTVANAFYNCFSRVSWSLGLSLFIYPTIVSPEKTHILTKIWNWTVWKVLAKLTFGLYLLHIIVIEWFVNNRMREIPYKSTDVILLFGSTLFWGYLVSALFYVTIENPLALLSGTLMKRATK